MCSDSSTKQVISLGERFQPSSSPLQGEALGAGGRPTGKKSLSYRRGLGKREAVLAASGRGGWHSGCNDLRGGWVERWANNHCGVSVAAQLIDGKALSQGVRDKIAQEAASLFARSGIKPGLAAILVGDDPASHLYVKNKEKACEAVGIYVADD